MYVVLDENSNNIIQRLISDDDKMLVVLKMAYNGNISQNRTCAIVNIFLKKGIFIILRFLSGAVFVNYEKQNALAHTYTHING